MKHIVILTVLTLITFLPFSAFSQEEPIVLEKIVVTATRHPQEISKVPANTTIITEEDIKASNAQNIVDVLRSEVGVVVRDALGNRAKSTVDIRGFGESAGMNVLVLVDGRRVNEIDLSAVDWAQIPINQVERIEIVRGLGSVLYGDNAVGGVINIITKEGEGKPSLELNLNIGSYEYYTGRAYFGGSTDKLSYSLWTGYQDTDGYRDNNNFRTRDYGGKVIYSLNDYLTLDLSGNYHEDDYGLPGFLGEFDNRRGSNFPDDSAKGRDYYVNIGTDNDFGKWGILEFDISYRNRKVDTYWLSYGLWNFITESEIETLGIAPRYTMENTIFGHKNKTIIGSDIYINGLEINQLSQEKVITRKTDIDKRSISGYIRDEFFLMSNLVIGGGYRYERTRYDFDSKDPIYGTSPVDDFLISDRGTFEVGATYLYHKNSNLFAKIGKSFRYPASDEYFSVWSIPPVNKSLHLQKAYHYDLGIRFYLFRDTHLTLTLFRIDMDDEIYYNPLTYSNENYDNTRHEGIEFSLDAKPHKMVHILANYAYTRAKFRGGEFDGNDIPIVPLQKASWQARFHFNSQALFSIIGNYVGRRYLISDQKNQAGKMDDYITVDVKFSYQWKKINAYVGINNLFEDEYSEYGVLGRTGLKVYYPCPEREVIGGLSFVF